MLKGLRILLALAASLLTAAVVLLAVILVRPEADEQTQVPQNQSLVQASQAINITDGEELSRITESFPVPILAFLNGAGPDFVDGSSYDAAFEDGFARIVTLKYRLFELDGDVTVQTVYPARALSFVTTEGYTLSTGNAVTVCGVSMVRMEGKDTIRLHGQNENALYIITMPSMSTSDMKDLLRTLQMTGEPES